MASFPQSGPREYRRSFSNWWWLERRNYLIFILREFSSIFVAYFLVVTLEQLCALARGPAAYASFQAHIRHPLVILLNIVPPPFLLPPTYPYPTPFPHALF